uniref:Dehydrogenase/reductase (SDR family) member 13a, duplicate 3 n=1 Tax=Neogobius melanostomus TaxID=47308 RepID=A0A8C6WJS4_9GOBI
MSLLLGLLGVAVFFYIIIYYTVFRGSRCTSQAKLHGKTAVVTGSNTGIGKATALDLAKRGARVILACRSRERAEAAVYDIRRESGNNQVLFMPLDLSSLQSVRDFVKTFLKTEPRLDFLINNAGVMGGGRTQEGFGMEFGVNHLGHFLLTLLLLERLKQSAPSRVVTVSSMVHLLGHIDFKLLESTKDLVQGDRNTLKNLQVYAHSKLCNVLFTRELANRLEGTNVSCFCLHPGLVQTEMGRYLGCADDSCFYSVESCSSWTQKGALRPLCTALFRRDWSLSVAGTSLTVLWHKCLPKEGTTLWLRNCGRRIKKMPSGALFFPAVCLSSLFSPFHPVLSCKA